MIAYLSHAADLLGGPGPRRDHRHGVLQVRLTLQVASERVQLVSFSVPTIGRDIAAGATSERQAALRWHLQR